LPHSRPPARSPMAASYRRVLEICMDSLAVLLLMCEILGRPRADVPLIVLNCIVVFSMPTVDKMVPWTVDPTATSGGAKQLSPYPELTVLLRGIGTGHGLGGPGRDRSPHYGQVCRRCLALCFSLVLWSARRCSWLPLSPVYATGEKSLHLCSSTCALPLLHASSRPSRPQMRPRP
jgi:hypothetical protein